jgi:hypothetical protein
MKQQLTDLIVSSGNCVNLGRSMKVKHQALYTWVFDNTAFIPADSKFTERLYCIANNILAHVQNEDGTKARFINMFRGYAIKPLPMQNPPLKGRPPKRTNLQNYITRNNKRNKHLYEATAILGLDYVICPATDTRKSMIEAKYINTVLGMTVEQYDQLYPNIQKVCTARINNIKAGVNVIDDATGLTKHQISVEKSKVALSQVGADGKSGYARKGQKTKATHLANVDELGQNGYERQAHGRLTTILPNGLTVEENAHIKQKETMIANNIGGTGGASKISKKKLKPILDFLFDNEISFYFDDTEYGIKDTDTQQYYFYDLTILAYNITIEYQSNAWHSNPSWDDARWDKWGTPKGKIVTALESLNYDYNKARSLYKFRNIVTYYVWEDTADQDVRDILCLLQTTNTKY